MNVSISEFLKLRQELPICDVRSEGEYLQGHVGGAKNIPILNNAERVAVGTDYKQKGQLEAIKTGFRLVGPRIIEIVNEAEQLADGRELLVHCWRGGMRSSNFCQFVGMAKVKTHQLQGGYKSYRAEAIKSFSLPFQFKVLSGFTGSGKTQILRELEQQGEQIIDLELLASHKGSAFGALMRQPQPTTEQFQNNLFEKVLTLDLTKPVWIEDESITIGKVVLPEPFWRRLSTSDMVEINVSKEERIKRLAREYGEAHTEEFLAAMEKISRKLGGQNFLASRQKYLEGDIHSSIDILLTYYDKTYRIGSSKNTIRKKIVKDWDGTDITGFASELLHASV